MKYRIGVFCQNIETASSWLRATWPIIYLAKEMGFDYHFFPGDNKVELAELFGYDMFLLTRPHDVLHVELITTLKRMKKKIWVDYDDNLWSVPYDHDEYAYFQLDTVRAAASESCQMADIITVTTFQIKAQMVTLGIEEAKIHVIPNAIDDYLFPEPAKHNIRSNNTILWRGGKTHNRDLVTAGPAISLLMRKNYRFYFLGHRPHSIEEYLVPGQFTVLPTQDIFSYLFSLQKINAPFHIVPLTDIALNKAKSNLAWLEGTWIGGSIVFVPKHMEWNAAVHYEPGQLAEAIEAQVKIPGDRQILVQTAQDYIREHFLLSKVNKARRILIEEHLR